MFELHSAPKKALPGQVQPVVPFEEQPGSLNSFIRFVNIVVRRRYAALAIFVSFVLLVAAGTALAPKRYTTEVRFIAGNPGGSVSQTEAGADSSLPVLNALLIASGEQSSETYAELFQETPVAQQVISDLHLNTTPANLLAHTIVTPVTNTSILRLAVSWSSPESSAAIANDFANVIIQRQRDLVSSQASQALKFLSTELPTAEKHAHDTDTALATYQATHPLTDINSETQSAITNYASLDSQLNQAQVNKRQVDAQLAIVEGQIAHTPATINGGTGVAVNPQYTALQSQLSQVELQLAAARHQYTDQHPAVIALVDQQNALRRQFASTPPTIVATSDTVPNPEYQQLQQQVSQDSSQQAAAAAQIAELSLQRNALNPQLSQLPKDVAQLADLQREAKSAQGILSALQQKYDSATIAKTTALSDVTVTQAAIPTGAAVSPSVKSNTLLALMLGIVLAISGVLVIDYFDDSIKNEKEAEERLALPNLGSVPDVQKKNGAAVSWVQSLAIESFLQLVTALKYSSDTPLRTVAITSPSQGDGKSTIALNTAIAMSELEPRVLLIDGDLRRPSLHTKLNIKNESGLSDILIGHCELRDAVVSTRYPGLDILPSGTPAPNPLKLLQSPRFDRLLERALESYRYVFVDSAACSANFDSAIVSTKVVGTVVVISANATETRAAKKALSKLEQIGVRNIVGFVLNRVAPSRNQFDGYYLQETTEERAASLMIEA